MRRPPSDRATVEEIDISDSTVSVLTTKASTELPRGLRISRSGSMRRAKDRVPTDEATSDTTTTKRMALNTSSVK
ncbi:MAG TPA: hypothetical protein VIL12_00525, partial [Acidimicrobiia bacterium]